MKTKDSRKAEISKRNYMSEDAFVDLKKALEDALAFERWERRDLRVTRIQGSRPPTHGKVKVYDQPKS